MFYLGDIGRYFIMIKMSFFKPSKWKIQRKLVFKEINDSLEKDLIFVLDVKRSNFDVNNHSDEKRIIPINTSRYMPLCGSFANEWMLSIIPDLTMNAPNKLKEKTIIESKDLC